MRDQVIDYITAWSCKTHITIKQLLNWIKLDKSKYHHWKKRYGKVNEHNGLVPRHYWLEAWEKQAIIDYYHQHALDGYRRLSYMLMDKDIVAASPSTVYRTLKSAGLLDQWSPKPSKKGQGFNQPGQPHDHWHVDISYLNLGGTFYYLCSVLDGFSRFLVHWEIREAMKEVDVELVIQKAKERYPNAKPRIISDNGPQFIAKDFKDFIRLSGMTHVRTSPYYPQSNGKIERWHKSIKQECIRPAAPECIKQARKLVGDYVNHYNTERLHSSIGYITPQDKLDGRADQIFQERANKLAAARVARKEKKLAKGELLPLAS